MPKIINAYSDANNSIADSLKSIGQSIWGDEAKNEGLRQNAEKLRRENAGRQGAAEAFRSGNMNELGAQGILGGMSAGDTSGYGLYGQANRYGARDPRTTNAWVGAGHNYSGSYPGFEETQAGEMARAQMAADRANASAERTADNTPVAAMGPNGQPGYYSRKEAMGGHLSPVTSKDQEEAMILRRSMQPQGMAPAPPPGAPQPQAPPQAGPQVAGPGAPMPAPAPVPHAPTGPGGPYDGLHPDVIGMIGGQPAVERDRDRRLLASVQGSNLPPEPAGRSQAQADVENTSGVWTGIGKGLAETMGTLFNTDLNPALTQATQAARDRATRTATGLAGANNLPAGVKTLHAEGTNVPGPGMFGLSGINAGTEGNRAAQLPRDLRTQWNLLKTFASDPNITPADREKTYAHMQALQRMIEDWEAPTPGAPAPQQPPQPAPSGGAMASPAMPMVSNPADAARLPRGTQFRDPAGNIRTVP